MPGMAGLVKTLLSSLPSMVNIMILFMFSLVIFGTIGVQFFKGIFLNRCVLLSSIPPPDLANKTSGIDSSFVLPMEIFAFDSEGNELFCQTDEDCPLVTDQVFNTFNDSFACLERGNPNFGLSNYDNILNALLTSFECITLEGWTAYMYMVRNVLKTNIFDAYFIINVLIGSFLILNLMIAVQFQFLDQSFNEIKIKR